MSKEWLFDLYHNAYFEVERDSDDDVCIRQDFRIWAFPIREGEQIRFMTQFRASPAHDLAERLLYVNRVNDELHIVRAYVDRDGDIGFDDYLVVSGGVTRRNIIFATRAFVDHVLAALTKDETEVIA
ncbi:YbjN domain-containing protein [uncultured Chloroflexus sp.]|uniref:YbjN domain-containing protein n=1 Tax=uncultured Chloroflexus sp. TaxID=214040 RepID=UPI00263016FD|nr:YbjN domain-containing protein [uncultured Chloroflexus sp.]